MDPNRPDPVVLSWVPELDDLHDALSFRTRTPYELGTYVTAIVLGLAVAVVGVLSRNGWVVAVPLLTIAILLCQLAGYGHRGAARGIWKNNSMFRLPVEAHVAPLHGITTTSPGMSSWYDWSRIARVRETPRVFVLQVDENRGGPFFVLAKRGLASPHDLAVLRTVLSVEVGSRSGTVLLLPS